MNRFEEILEDEMKFNSDIYFEAIQKHYPHFYKSLLKAVDKYAESLFGTTGTVIFQGTKYVKSKEI